MCRLFPALLLTSLIVLVTGCGSAEPLLDPTVVPRHAVAGQVIDGANGQPVAGVEVFVAGTSYRTTTGGRGGFRFAGVPLGSYDVVAYLPGYATATTPIAHGAAVTEDVRLTLSVANATQTASAGEDAPPEQAEAPALSPAVADAVDALQQRIEQLERRVTLLSRQVSLLRDEQRGTTLLAMNQEDLDTFNRFFLGDDPSECRVLNPGVLSFEPAEDQPNTILRATTDQPLEVLNRRLGYRLYVAIGDFGVARSGQRYTVFSDARISFERLTPADEDEAEQWREARQRAYTGSLTHLLRALGAGRTGDEGFALSQSVDIRQRTSAGLGGQSYTQEKWVPVRDLSSRVTATEEPYIKQFSVDRTYQVQYDQATWYLASNAGDVAFTVLGQPLAADALRTEGYWQTRPVCQRVPTTYVPPLE